MKLQHKYYDFKSDYHGERKVPPPMFRNKYYSIEAMNIRHHEIARLLVLGCPVPHICARLEIGKSQVYNVANSPIVKEQMAYLSGNRDAETVKISDQINAALPDCVQYITDTIGDPNVSASLKSKNAFGLLAIGGYSPQKNVNVRSVHAILTPGDISEIREQAERIGIVDAEYSEDEN